MIAAFAFLAVPAAMYLANPEFTCGDIDPPQDEPRSDDDDVADSKDSKEMKVDNKKEDEKEAKQEVTKEEKKKEDQKPGPNSVEKRSRGQTDEQKAVEEAKLRRERLLQAANDVLNRQDQPRSAEKPTAKQMESRRASTGSRNLERPLEFSPPVTPIPTPSPASFVRPEKIEKVDAPVAQIVKTPPPPVASAPIVPRSNSAYKMRVEHQQQQQLVNQQQAAAPLARPVSPMRPKNEPQQSETVSPRAREDRLSTLQHNSTSSSPSTVTTGATSPASTNSGSGGFPREAKESPSAAAVVSARTTAGVSPAAVVAGSKNSSPVPTQVLPPLIPKRREDQSPVPLKVPSATTTPVATTSPAPVVVSPVPAAIASSTYLTPREKQQRALAELRRQEEDQRNMAKVMIQEELQRALDELHKQEALQRQQDESERSLVQEEQRRRELVQQAILEEKMRIEQDDELQREERRKLKEQQKAMEAQQRQADQRAMAELLLEVERDRQRDEQRAQEVQLSRVEQLLLDEQQRQHEILEQLRLQNQYPYPRGHPLSNIPNIDTSPISRSASQSASPMISPDVSPNSSMRMPYTSSAGPPTISPISSTSRDGLDAKVSFKGIPVTSGSATSPTAVATDGAYQSPYHSRLTRPASGQTPATPLVGSSNKQPSPATPVVAGATSADPQARRSLSTQRQGGAPAGSPEKQTAESVNRMIMEQMHSLEEQQFDAVVEENRRDSAGSGTRRLSTTSSYRKSTSSTVKTTSTTTTTATSRTNTPGATSPLRRSLPGSATSLTKTSPHPEESYLDDPLPLPEDAEQRILNAREELALKIDAYIRTQKKFSSAVPRKHKVSIAKVNTECEKYRRAYNEQVGDDAVKISSMQHFLQSHPRFNVTGGGQMVGVAYLTPYQASDSRRVYGHFRCTKCIKYWMESGVNKSDFREWQNAYSYKDCFQACYQCDVQVYPYHQRLLKKNELHFDDRAKHDVGRCSKCESLRKPCYEA